MARTRQEIRDFLNAQVGQQVNAKAGVYSGQCVSLIKALLEFLGAPNPYGARGNAKDVGDTYLREGIAENRKGWLNVCVNRDMGLIGGVRYGHVWIDVSGEMNIEQNGAIALRTTKNTRPISQAQQIITLDKWVKPDNITGGADMKTDLNQSQWRSFIEQVYIGFRGSKPTKSEVDFHMANSNPLSFVNGFNGNYLWQGEQAKNKTLQAEVTRLNKQIDTDKKELAALEKQLAERPTSGTDPYAKDTNEKVNWIADLLGRIFK